VRQRSNIAALAGQPGLPPCTVLYVVDGTGGVCGGDGHLKKLTHNPMQ
jgi:hypothetical protein